ISFLQNFILPNSIKFAVPPLEFLGVYNMGGDSVGTLAKTWFNYKSLKVQEHPKHPQEQWMTKWYPVFSTLVNLLLFIHLFGLVALRGLSQADGLGKFVLLLSVLWLANMGFSIFASPIVLRYQVFPSLVSLILAMVAGNMLYRSFSKQ